MAHRAGPSGRGARTLGVLSVLSAAILLSACATPPPAPPYVVKGPIEAKYQARGPWAVSQSVSAGPCDRENHLCDIWYPTALGTNPLRGVKSGYRHPVISWADGTGQQPKVYAHFLEHLASWGFIVVAPRDDSTRAGETTLDAAQYMLAQADTPSSRFYNRVDPDKFGAAGHSQGGAAVTSLHVRGVPLFKTYLGLHTSPGFFSKFCCGVTPESYAGARVTASIFQWSSKPDSGKPDWYDPVPNSAPKAYALLSYANHADVSAAPGCDPAACRQGASPYLGYTTAWLMGRLQGASDGVRAFGQDGEFFRSNPSWSMNLSNIP
ncbi:hypothetical protein V7S57_00685 [Caulobacter sp. CCNWLY153]|uniref:Alpha/beta hydrolase n=1 Tax=Caulobacter radicis TaxID=2172650 RepID=A0A2T9J7P0_9CAUL|nr:hypothetical protein [Caulobacter radicis]PVM77533.1 hypothetical protein DDF65_16550 [Caulobacter radicis]